VTKLRIGDAQWGAFVALRRPCVPEATARAELERALDEYHGFVFDPKKLAAERERQRRIIKPARDLVAALAPSKGPLPFEHEVVAWVLRLAEGRLAGLNLMARAREGRRDPDREFLIGRLSDVWIKSFGGTLTVTDRPGMEPVGDLVSFIQLAAEALNIPPVNPHTIRNVVLRQHDEREYLRRER
jgi:hypothetical protein